MRKQNGVGLYRTYCTPCEFQLRQLFLGSSFAGSQRPRRCLIALSLIDISFLEQTATGNFLDLNSWCFMLSNKNADILLALQNLYRAFFISWRDNDLSKDIRDLGCHLLGNFAVDCDDATKSRHRVTRMRSSVSRSNGLVRISKATRVCVLDDSHASPLMITCRTPCCVRILVVVVAHIPSL